MKRPSVWNRNFCLLSTATIFGAAGGIAARYAMSFLVYEETESVLASALVLCVQLIPAFLLPLVAGPVFDRHSRKKALCLGDAANGLLYLAMGIYLLNAPFTYVGYLFFSLLLACVGALDELAFTSILPMCLSKGTEQKSYAVTNMIYPFLNGVMMPAGAWLMKVLGIPWILIAQGFLSFAACLIESRMKLLQDVPDPGKSFSFTQWSRDLKEAWDYLRHEKGILSFFVYSAFGGGISQGEYPVLVAFFSTAPGFSPLLFSWFAAAESIGRVLGGFGLYAKEMQPKKKFGFSIFVFVTYQLMDACLLFLRYPWMLANRCLCGALGMTSATIRESAVQSYIPERMRARINSFSTLLYNLVPSILMLLIGWMADHMAAGLVMVICSILEFTALCFTWILHRKACEHVFLDAVGSDELQECLSEA